MAEQLAAGWDGGGTKTRVCITDGTGAEIGVRDFGPLNINGASEAEVRGTIFHAVEFMRETAGGEDCAQTVIGMAGISNRNAVQFLENTLRDCGCTGKVKILGDLEIALEGAVSGHGGVLIAGTGSVLNGRDRAGHGFRVGGYGYLIDDPGSGYAIGRGILRCVVRAEDGRSPVTGLRDSVFRTLQISDIGELITWLYAPSTGRQEIAALARLLPQALEEGDHAAKEIADSAARELTEMVLAGWRKTGMQDGELALAGGILEHMTSIREGLISGVHAVFPDIRIGFPKSDPAHGAAKIARRMIETGE